MQAEGRWAALDESIFARGCSPRLPQLAITPSLRERLGASLLSQREPGGVLSGKGLGFSQRCLDGFRRAEASSGIPGPAGAQDCGQGSQLPALPSLPSASV